jgi:hypothetical protein
VKRPTAAYLDEITGIAEQWLRRCNKQPAEGRPVSARGLRIVLASSWDVRADKDGTITWSAAAGKFSAEPVRDETPH